MTKRALLIGINYIGTNYELYGCINDVVNMRRALISDFYYNKDNVILITDTTEVKPTKSNIVNQIKKVVSETRDGDTLFFHYSGHGYHRRDNPQTRGGDEIIDGRDEMICPLDEDIIDDELNQLLVKSLASGASLRCIIDSCHSGSSLDLPFRIDSGTKIYVENDQKKYIDAFMISGCRDSEVSFDAIIESNYSGALTWAFLHVMKQFKDKDIYWRDLITIIRYELMKSQYEQVPQLSFMFKNQLDDRVVL